MNTLERAKRKIMDAAAPHPYCTKARFAVLDEEEAKAIQEHIEWLRQERLRGLDARAAAE